MKIDSAQWKYIRNFFRPLLLNTQQIAQKIVNLKGTKNYHVLISW